MLIAVTFKVFLAASDCADAGVLESEHISNLWS